MKQRSVLLLIGLCMNAATQGSAQFQPFQAAVGLRVGYGNLGGDQLAGLTDGIVADGFLRLPIREQFGVELGANVGAHEMHFLCAWPQPCLRPAATVVSGLYVAPLARAVIPDTRITGYGGVRVGMAFGDFQDAGSGLETGLIVGSALPLFRNLAADVSVVGSIIHVGTDQPRSGMGRWAAVRVGVTYALRDGTAEPKSR